MDGARVCGGGAEGFEARRKKKEQKSTAGSFRNQTVDVKQTRSKEREEQANGKIKLKSSKMRKVDEDAFVCVPELFRAESTHSDVWIYIVVLDDRILTTRDLSIT